jgi:hypothetical protein
METHEFSSMVQKLHGEPMFTEARKRRRSTMELKCRYRLRNFIISGGAIHLSPSKPSSLRLIRAYNHSQMSISQVSISEHFQTQTL